MNNQLNFTKSVMIQAPVAEVWKALTTPSLIKEYLFGTETITDWKKGSPIIFQGVWENKPYMDKGVILDIVPEKLIRYSYWSSFSGLEDVPENYSNIRYELSPAQAGSTTFTLTQEGFQTPEARDHSASNWSQLLEGIKSVAEKQLQHLS
jgi:uncharacterized protein YndB with AHSA1/START domain